ncbi:MAG: PDZ domain-containing protein, partial [Myxococcota bacterium]
MGSPPRQDSPGARRTRTGLLAAFVIGATAASLVWLVTNQARVRGWESDSATGSARTRPGRASDPEWTGHLAALEAEIAARKQLASELAELREALGRSGAVLTPDAPSDEETDSSASATEEGGENEAAALATGRGFDVEALVRVGFDPREAERLRNRWEEFEMEKLYLRDLATREGWGSSPRHRQEQQGLALALAEGLGDDDYDALLYATGQPNRVLVTDVLESSPASSAGLERGDTILRYDGERIYGVGELRRATAAGEAGQFVPVEVLRDSHSVTLYVR